MIGYVGFSFLKTRQVPHIELKIVQNQLLLINSKAFPWHLELSFTKKITLKGFLNNVKMSEIGTRTCLKLGKFDVFHFGSK